MRIAMGAINEFVSAVWSVPEMPVLGTDWPPSMQLPPAGMTPGMGGLADFIGAKFAVPQTPVVTGMSGLADFVGAKFAVPQNPVLDAGIGDLVSTQPMYPLDQNTVLAAAQAAGLAGLGAGKDCGCGCGGAGGCGGGMGSLADISTFVSGQWAKIQAGDVATIALWGGGALLVAFVLFSGAKKRRARRSS